MLGTPPQRKSNSPANVDSAAGSKLSASPSAAQADFWLGAHYDPVANLKTFSTCLHTCDLFGDGDWRLAVAGLDKKLKVNMSLLFSDVTNWLHMSLSVLS